jgi:hypothetical protein
MEQGPSQEGLCFFAPVRARSRLDVEVPAREVSAGRQRIAVVTANPEAASKGLALDSRPQAGCECRAFRRCRDRPIPEALHQVLQSIFDLTLSDPSYGFRPGRNAPDALRRAQQYVASGKRRVVDIDPEKLFDRVDHDLLMSKPAGKFGLACVR